MFVFFVDLVFLFHLLTGGFDPHFPLLPMPRPLPRFLALSILPCFSADLLCPVEILVKLCSVYFLQYLQYLLTVFGSFILLPTPVFCSTRKELFKSFRAYMALC